eukprot:2411793-Prorocentrum_lima.AAC.1
METFDTLHMNEFGQDLVERRILLNMAGSEVTVKSVTSPPCSGISVPRTIFGTGQGNGMDHPNN